MSARRWLVIGAAAAYIWTAPALAQAPVEKDFFNSIWGISATAALLVMLVIAVFRFLLSDRARMLTALEKSVTDKETITKEAFELARDNKDAFKEATSNVKEGRDETRRLHGETHLKLDAMLVRVTAIESKMDSILAANRRP